jgi:hypothetical protein
MNYIHEFDFKSISHNSNSINNRENHNSTKTTTTTVTTTKRKAHQNHSKHTTNKIPTTTTQVVEPEKISEQLSAKLKELINLFMKKLKSLTDTTIAPQKKKEHISKLRKLQDEIKVMLEQEPALYYVDIQDIIDETSNGDNNKTDTKSGTIKKPFKWGK